MKEDEGGRGREGQEWEGKDYKKWDNEGRKVRGRGRKERGRGRKERGRGK